MEDMLKNITRGLHDASKTMLEANKANKAKKSAFRAGAKAAKADNMSGSATKYDVGRYSGRSEIAAKTVEKKAAKEAAKDKAVKMRDSAKEKLKKLGKSPKSASTTFNKGKDLAKAAIQGGHTPSRDKADQHIATNASYKKHDSKKSDRIYSGSGEGRGRFLQLYHKKKFGEIADHIEDLHRKIRDHLDSAKPKYNAHEKEGGKAIDNAKAHLAKLQKLHASINEEATEEEYTELVTETLNLVEEVTVLAELYGDKE